MTYYNNKENSTMNNKTKGKRYDEMYLLSIYNGKLYFFTRDTLKSLTLSSGAVKTLKKNFIGWDKLQIRATKGISATSRYIYGTFPAEPDKVYLYDCKTGNMKKLLNMKFPLMPLQLSMASFLPVR